jgi:competence protein ComEA
MAFQYTMLKIFALLLALWMPAFAWAVDVNQANEAELDSVKDLGPSSTARILKARESGPFKDCADFMQRVKGIKPAAARRLSSAGLTVNGKSFESSTQ